MYIKGENCTNNFETAESKKRFRDNYRKAFGIEEREYNGVMQLCRCWEGEWIPEAEYRHRLVEKDREEARLKAEPKKHGILIGYRNACPIEIIDGTQMMNGTSKKIRRELAEKILYR